MSIFVYEFGVSIIKSIKRYDEIIEMMSNLDITTENIYNCLTLEELCHLGY
jgi:hypothetical protein